MYMVIEADNDTNTQFIFLLRIKIKSPWLDVKDLENATFLNQSKLNLKGSKFENVALTY